MIETIESLDGVYDHDIFRNEDSGWTVGVIETRARRKPVTVVGVLTVQPGESLELRGRWVMDPKFGEQFQVSECHARLPSTLEGLRKYLSSGLIKGIGPAYAERLLERFGLEVPKVIEEQPHRLREISGIGRERQKRIVVAWNAQKEIKNLMIFLQGHGVSAGLALKVFKAYGNNAIEKIKENPYRLAADLTGVGFKTADQIAEKIGISKEANERLDSAIEYVLKEAAESQGNTGMAREALKAEVTALLEVDESLVEARIVQIAGFSGRLLIKTIEGREVALLHRYYDAEVRIAERLSTLHRAKESAGRPVQWDKFFVWFKERRGIEFSPEQKDAVRLGYEENIAVITGGPGTGKSTLVEALTVLCEKLNLKVGLTAPTGRAAKRLNEVTKKEAKTIHRLLEFDPVMRGFKRGKENPLDCDLLIVDEVSMVDVLLCDKLLQAVREGTRVVLVGDHDQLPSVGPGNVLRDLIRSTHVPVVKLKKIFRQSDSSRITVVAHEIRDGVVEEFFEKKEGSDFHFIERDTPESCAEAILDLVAEKIPRRISGVSKSDVQVLVPMNRGVVGTQNLNQMLQKRLNPSLEVMEKGSRRFAVGDRVIQTRNNYDLEVFNGDIGFISRVNPQDKEMTVRFDEREVVLDSVDIDDLELAYAITIHKSQGSEFPVVVLPILTQHAILLQRNLLYTGITRGKRLVIVVGSKKAIGMAVNRIDGTDRCTYLQYALSAEFTRVPSGSASRTTSPEASRLSPLPQ